MVRETKVQESSTSNSAENDLEDEEEQHRAYMIKEFGKKGFKEIKKLMEKLEKRGSVSIGKKTCSSLRRRETLP
jgi:hypothetical protein